MLFMNCHLTVTNLSSYGWIVKHVRSDLVVVVLNRWVGIHQWTQKPKQKERTTGLRPAARSFSRFPARAGQHTTWAGRL